MREVGAETVGAAIDETVKILVDRGRKLITRRRQTQRQGDHRAPTGPLQLWRCASRLATGVLIQQEEV